MTDFKHDACCMMIVTLCRCCNRVKLLITSLIITNKSAANPLKLARNDKTVLTQVISDISAVPVTLNRNSEAISASQSQSVFKE